MWLFSSVIQSKAGQPARRQPHHPAVYPGRGAIAIGDFRLPTSPRSPRPRQIQEGELVMIRHPARGQFRAVVELQVREAGRVR